MNGKIKLMVGAAVLVALVAIGTTGLFVASRFAYAAPPNPDNNGTTFACGGTGGMMGGFGGMMGGFGGMMGFLDQVTLDKVAKLVGLSSEDLQTQLRSGKSLAELAKDKASEQQFVDILTANHKEMIQLKQKQVYLTQDQATQMTQAMEQAAKDFINSKSLGSTGPRNGAGMMGGRGGAGMMGGFGGNGGFGGMMGGYR